MPYQFAPELDITGEPSPVMFVVRDLLRNRPILITDEEWRALPSQYQGHFVRVNRTYALNQTGAVHDRMRAEGQEQLSNRVRAAQNAQAAQQLTQNIPAGADIARHWTNAEQSVEDARRLLERAAAQPRRPRPAFPGATTHSNEGDIEPEDL